MNELWKKEPNNGDEYRDMGFVIRETYELARQLSEA